MCALKRRSPSRRKSDKLAVKGVNIGVPKQWANEAMALMYFALGLILLLSFISYKIANFADTETLRVLNLEQGRNWIGPLGRLVGTLLSGFLGWATLVPIVLLFMLAWQHWNEEKGKSSLEVNSKLVVCLGLLGMLLSASALICIFWGSSTGGMIGEKISRPLLTLFGNSGASIFIICAFLLCVALSLKLSVGKIISQIGKGLLIAALFVFVSLPLVLLHAVTLSLSAIWNAIAFLFFKSMGIPYKVATAMAKAGVQSEPKEALPLPRLRRNSIKDNLEKSQIRNLEVKEEPRPPLLEEGKVVVVTRKEDKLKAIVSRARQDKLQNDSFAGYSLPDLALLNRGEVSAEKEDEKELFAISKQIESKLKDFAILGRVTHVHPGPVVTLFEFEPAPGVKVGKIAALQDDLAMSLRASSIRIIAPIPRRGTVGIEVPNKRRDLVRLRDLLESEACQTSESILGVPLGKDTYGDPVIVDIAVMPHLLMAGATGTGKSVCINAILLSLLYRASPAELGLILIDPKILELSVYEGVPHLRVPVVTHPRQARAVLEWAANEMNRRYRVMQKFGVRGLDSYNKVVKGESARDIPEEIKKGMIELKETEVLENGTVEPAEDADTLFTEELKPMPKIVIVIDELADLMLSGGREIEVLITRLAQKARAAGIHLILATQRPSVDVITGLIKANFPARISFRVASRVDSRTILDQMGADKLLGRGDMLLMQPGAEVLRRVHGAFVSDTEVKRVVASIKESCTPQYDQRIMEICEKALEDDKLENNIEISGDVGDYDAFYDQAVALVTEKGQASTSMLQRAFRIGYNRAARIIEMMEKEGVVGPMDGVKPREILVPSREVEEL